MTHPLLLHFRASSWSLNAARGALHERARDEAEVIAAEVANATDDGIRSTVMGVRGGGGHGDPVSGVALAGITREPRPNRYAQLADSVAATLTWLADTLRSPDARDPLVRLNHTHLAPGTAATVTRWLDDSDRRIRDSIGLAPHLWALPGTPECPGCRMRSLYVQTAAPSHLWTVVCRAGCVCSGEGCRCTMPVTVEGAAHIWAADHPLAAAALAPYLPTAAAPEGITDITLPGLETVR